MALLNDVAVHADVNCFECGKPVTSIPSWLAGAKIKFQCEECRQKHPRPSGMQELDNRRSAATEAEELTGYVEIDGEPEEEDIEDDVIDIA